VESKISSLKDKFGSNLETLKLSMTEYYLGVFFCDLWRKSLSTSQTQGKNSSGFDESPYREESSNVIIEGISDSRDII